MCTQSTGIFDQEFVINANKGQHLKLSVINLSHLTESVKMENEEIGYVLDAETEKVVSIHMNSKAESPIALIESHSASIVLSSNPKTSFLIAFQGR